MTIQELLVRDGYWPTTDGPQVGKKKNIRDEDLSILSDGSPQGTSIWFRGQMIPHIRKLQYNISADGLAELILWAVKTHFNLKVKRYE
jgi:hypothetical protein